MSRKFLLRLAARLPSTFRRVSTKPEERKELDKEFEKITGMDCDKAATTLSNEGFDQAALQAVANLRKKKKVSETPEQQAYAYA